MGFGVPVQALGCCACGPQRSPEPVHRGQDEHGSFQDIATKMRGISAHGSFEGTATRGTRLSRHTPCGVPHTCRPASREGAILQVVTGKWTDNSKCVPGEAICHAGNIWPLAAGAERVPRALPAVLLVTGAVGTSKEPSLGSHVDARCHVDAGGDMGPLLERPLGERPARACTGTLHIASRLPQNGTDTHTTSGALRMASYRSDGHARADQYQYSINSVHMQCLPEPEPG